MLHRQTDTPITLLCTFTFHKSLVISPCIRWSLSPQLVNEPLLVKDPSRSKTWNRQIIYLRKAVFSLNITIQAWSAFIACEMNKSIPTLTVEGLENGQTERRNTALRGVKIYDIMSCRIPACMIQVCIRKVLSVFFLLDFEVMIRVFKYITIKYTVFKRIILHLTLLQKWKPELQLLIV